MKALVVFVYFCWLVYPLNALVPYVKPTKVYVDECPSGTPSDDAGLDAILQQLSPLLPKTGLPLAVQEDGDDSLCVCSCPQPDCGDNPLETFSSCKDILSQNPSAQSDYYWIHDGTGPPVYSYCDMVGTHCDGVGGWTRIANVDMAIGGQCPGDLVEMTFSGIKVCGRFESSDQGCSSAFFPAPSPYSQVCGRLRGYMYGTPDAFAAGGNSVDDHYVDGISLTYGSNPRHHIWTYAGGLEDDLQESRACPCNNGNPIPPPDFVGNDYYCESANSGPYQHYVFYNEDILWDGEDCNGVEETCCINNKMPWFLKQLDVNQTLEAVELRVCTSDGIPTQEDTPVNLIELYIR